MNRWTSPLAMFFVAILATASFAQSPEQVRQELDALKAAAQSQANAIAKLQQENDALKAQVNGGTAVDTEINRLSERMAANTTLKSDATQIKMGGEFRFRSNWTLGDFVDDNGGDGGVLEDFEHDGQYTDARVRVNFMYDFTCDVTAFVELQSHWAFGDNTSTSVFGGQTDVELYQGWLEVRNLFNRPEFSSRTGRQEICLGNQFQFGNADWFNGVSFDGTRLDWNSESFSLTGLILRLANSEFGDINQWYTAWTNDHDDDELYGLYFTLKTIKNHKLDLYWLYVNGHNGGAANSGVFFPTLVTPFLFSTGTAYYHTIGARLGGWFDVACGLDYNIEAAYQFGDGNSPDTDIQGLSVEGELGITFSKASRFRVFARGLYAEGPDDDDSGYMPLYPNRHSNTANFRARYGIADIIPMANVFTLQLGAHFDPAQNWTLGATFLWATADEDLVSVVGGTNLDDDYGWELDLWGEHRYSDNLTFGGGIAFIFPEDQAGALDDSTQVLAYLQARLWF